MNHWSRGQITLIVVIIVLSKSNAKTQIDKTKDVTEILPLEFMKFVNGLDKMVFKTVHKKTPTRPPKLPKKKIITGHTWNRRRNELRATQNAALRDMLMMKLVSYYEDKYKVERAVYSTPRILLPSRTTTNRRATTTNVTDYKNTNIRDNVKFSQTWAPDVTKNSKFSQDYKNTLYKNTSDATQDFAEVVVL